MLDFITNPRPNGPNHLAIFALIELLKDDALNEVDPLSGAQRHAALELVSGLLADYIRDCWGDYA